MEPNLLDLYRQASDWTAEKVRATKDLDAGTPCDDWQVRDLLNHMLETQRYFLGAARGDATSPPGPTPPDMLSADPVADFEQTRREVNRDVQRRGCHREDRPGARR